MSNLLVLLPLILALIPGLVACDRKNDDLQQDIHTILSKPNRPLEPLPIFTPLSQFAYPETLQRRSPFQSGKEQEVMDLDKHRLKEKLEEFALDSMTFVGTLQKDGLIWALILGPDKQIYRVEVGQHMGRHDGVIVSISNQQIQVRESRMVKGQWTKKIAILNMNIKE